MNAKGIKIFSTCIIIVFVFALSFFGISVYKEIQTGKEKASNALNTIINDTTMYINYYGITEDFTIKYTEYMQSNPDIAALVIIQDSNTCFAYPMSSPVFEIDNFGDPVINGNSPIISVFSSSLPTDNYTKVSITTAIYLIRPSKIFSLAKISFLIILVATALVFFVIILHYKKDTAEISNSNQTEINNPIIETNDLQVQQNETSTEEIVETTPEKNEVENVVNQETNIQEVTEEEKPTPEVFQEQVVSPDYKPLASNISDPQGLFSDHTGFGWESYFETRLDSELARSASSEQDLALFLVKIENITFQNHIIPYLTNILLNKFKFRDLIFEYGTNGFAAIVQGIDLNRAMALGQDLYTDISGLLINKQMNNKVGIGITTRSLRLITGNRLIEEANQALDKAFEEEGLPIVAFRVNPEKYRQYLVNEE